MRIKPAEAKHYDEQINRCKDDFPLVLCRKLFYLVHSTPLLRIILSLQRVEQDLHQVAVALEAGDLGGCFAGGRVGAGHGDLAGLQAQLGCADAQIRQQLIPGKDIAQRTHVGMGQVLAAVRAVGVGGVGEPLVRPQADERRMDEPHRRIAHRRG